MRWDSKKIERRSAMQKEFLEVRYQACLPYEVEKWGRVSSPGRCLPLQPCLLKVKSMMIESRGVGSLVGEMLWSHAKLAKQLAFLRGCCCLSWEEELSRCVKQFDSASPQKCLLPPLLPSFSPKRK